MKTCIKCGEIKPLSQFVRANINPKTGRHFGDGYKTFCLSCSAKRKKQIIQDMTEDERLKYNEKKAKSSMEWSKKRPFYQRAMKANLHARRVGAIGTVTEEDVIDAWMAFDNKCWCCGYKAEETDHLRPLNRCSGGTNTRNNLRPICRECNQKRSHKWHGESVANKEAKLLKKIKELLHEKQSE